MSLTPEQQIHQEITKARRPLIVFRRNFTGDSVAAAAALFLVLKKLGKTGSIVASGFQLPSGFKFLPSKDEIKSELKVNRELVISLDINKTEMENFHYDTTDKELKIFLTPKAGEFGPTDIKAAIADFPYDLIITLDTPDLESLGEIYTLHRDFFYSRPVINIDYSAANENYGAINFIDLTSGSTCGVVYNLIKSWGENLFDADINTCLLTGIIDKTKSFKTGLISPQTLQVASNLIERQARREEIVRNLYFSRDVATLRLWGTVLVKLKNYYNNKLVTAAVSRDDFAATSTGPENLPDIMEELITAIPGVDLIVLLYQKENSISVLLKSLGHFDPGKALEGLKPTGDRSFSIIELPTTDLPAAEKQILDEIQKTYQPRFE